MSGRRGPGQGLRGAGEPVCALRGWLSRPHARGWAAARALPPGQEDAAWRGQGPAITSEAAHRDPWQDQGEATRHITKPGTQVGPGPPAGSRRSWGWAKAPLSPDFWLCSVRITLPLRCNVRVCTGRLHRSRPWQGFRVERGQLSVQRGVARAQQKRGTEGVDRDPMRAGAQQ